MWDGISRNGTDQNHVLYIFLSDISDWGSAVASWISYDAPSSGQSFTVVQISAPACLVFFFFCWCFSARPSWLRPPVFGRSTLSSTVWSPKVNPKQWKTWPKMNVLLISGVYPWQIQQMGSVSKHPLWPGGSSCSSTGATHKHTNEILTEIKCNRGQPGFNLG